MDNELIKKFVDEILEDVTESETELFAEFSPDDEDESEIDASKPDKFPILPLKNTILFPGMPLHITIVREKSVEAIQAAYKNDRNIIALAQRDFKVKKPQTKDLYKIGTLAKILKLIQMSGGTTVAILKGIRRVKLIETISEKPFMMGRIEYLKYAEANNEIELEALVESIKGMVEKVLDLMVDAVNDLGVKLSDLTTHNSIINYFASTIDFPVIEKQEILEINNLEKKALSLIKKIEKKIQVLELKDHIESKVRGDIEKQQKEYYLNQQLKTIKEELGQNPSDEEIDKLIKKAQKKDFSQEATQTFQKEIGKLKRINPKAPEYSVQLNYLELMLDLPWHEYTKDNFDLVKVKKVLDHDHFGLTKVKERILEHLAVLKLKGDMKAPILCLVGPPGVGKTSLGKSISRAINRKFIRMSLGGLHDESEIRGHRRTYIGAMPGRIIQSLKKVGASNPVFILDEIDKVGKDFRGDPSSALLEVLDPEQNSSFQDNYLNLEYDLSKVLFIATANSLTTIQPALLDRMEIIQVSGYSVEEKLEIAKRHLIPNQRKDHGLKADQIKLPSKLVKYAIQNYTRESGVRSLDRLLGSLMRNIAKKVAIEEEYNPTLKIKDVVKTLGPEKFTNEIYQQSQVPGVAIGLAWTSVGGEILFIEAILSKGKGKMQLTGNLGDVMKESASTALSYLKAHGETFGLDMKKFEEFDLHIHVPEGAIPKDGPSAGITLLSAMTSIYTKKRVKPYLAMTGEITLRGKVLPVGGIKEKILAAKRAGMKEVMLSSVNKKHVQEIQDTYIDGLEFHYVNDMMDVLSIALQQ